MTPDSPSRLQVTPVPHSGQKRPHSGQKRQHRRRRASFSANVLNLVTPLANVIQEVTNAKKSFDYG